VQLCSIPKVGTVDGREREGGGVMIDVFVQQNDTDFSIAVLLHKNPPLSVVFLVQQATVIMTLNMNTEIVPWCVCPSIPELMQTWVSNYLGVIPKTKDSRETIRIFDFRFSSTQSVARESRRVEWNIICSLIRGTKKRTRHNIVLLNDNDRNNYRSTQCHDETLLHVPCSIEFRGIDSNNGVVQQN
jgi:hypothetical protein